MTGQDGHVEPPGRAGASVGGERATGSAGERQRAENAGLREELAPRDGELERVNAELAVLKRMLFGRSSERARPGTATGDDGGDGGGQARPAGSGKTGERGLGARAGRRDYSHLPRVEVVWDFPGGGYCCSARVAFGELSLVVDPP
jgi:hypothetical protein